MLGQSGYTLTCRARIIGNFCPTITYQWIKNNGTAATQLEITSNTLSFSSLRLSDAGKYTCNVTISSPTLSNDVTVAASHNIRLYSKSMYLITNNHFIPNAVPGPTNVILSSSTPNPIRPIGSTVTLTCTIHIMELNPTVDVAMTVNAVIWQWSGPARGSFLPINSSQPVIGDTTTYTFTTMISSFGRNQSGLYACLATLHSALTNNYIDESFGRAYIVTITSGKILLRNIIISN